MSGLTKLKHLDLSNNTAFDAGAVTDLSVLTALEFLDLGNTNRNGTFPTLSALTKLKHLDLSDNAFDASIVPAWVNSDLTDLEYLDLGSTNRNGAFPTLSGLTKLKHLDLSNNAFTESAIPTWFSSLTALEYLDLSNTKRKRHHPHPIRQSEFPDVSRPLQQQTDRQPAVRG